jgi:hypothetical protein
VSHIPLPLANETVVDMPVALGYARVSTNLDVPIDVLSGSGTLTTEMRTINLSPGALLCLPQLSRRQVTAGPDGLR